MKSNWSYMIAVLLLIAALTLEATASGYVGRNRGDKYKIFGSRRHSISDYEDANPSGRVFSSDFFNRFSSLKGSTSTSTCGDIDYDYMTYYVDPSPSTPSTSTKAPHPPSKDPHETSTAAPTPTTAAPPTKPTEATTTTDRGLNSPFYYVSRFEFGGDDAYDEYYDNSYYDEDEHYDDDGLAIRHFGASHGLISEPSNSEEDIEEEAVSNVDNDDVVSSDNDIGHVAQYVGRTQEGEQSSLPRQYRPRPYRRRVPVRRRRRRGNGQRRRRRGGQRRRRPSNRRRRIVVRRGAVPRIRRRGHRRVININAK